MKRWQLLRGACLMALFAMAQVLDFATFRPSHEANPLIMLNGFAIWIKIALVVYVTTVVIATTATHRYQRVGPVVLYLGAWAGIVGALTNLTAVPRGV